MAKISRETAIEHLADIAIHYLDSYTYAKSLIIDDYGGKDCERELKELVTTSDRDMNRIKYLKTVIEERNNDHDTAAEPADTAAADAAPTAAADAAAAAAITAAATVAAKSAADAAASAAVTATAAAAHFVRNDGTGADEQA